MLKRFVPIHENCQTNQFNVISNLFENEVNSNEFDQQDFQRNVICEMLY